MSVLVDFISVGRNRVGSFEVVLSNILVRMRSASGVVGFKSTSR